MYVCHTLIAAVTIAIAIIASTGQVSSVVVVLEDSLTSSAS